MKVVFAVVLSFLVSCVGKREIPDVLLQLEGTWQRVGKPDNFETWEMGEESILSAENYRIEEGEKRVLEIIKIEQDSTSWYYIPDVPHNPTPVPFLITEFGDTYFHSENPDHDFPKWIRYNFSEPDSMTVMIGDQKDTVYFRFFRSP